MNIKRKLQKAAAVSSAVLFGLSLTATNITWANADSISAALHQPNASIVKNTDKIYTAEELEYFGSQYRSIKEVVYNGFQIQEEEQKEGTVLLKNENNALPLKKGSKVSVFGVSGAYPFYGASGSGGINTSEAIDWYKAFEGYSHSDPKAPKELVKGETLLELNPGLCNDFTAWGKGSAGGWGRPASADFPEYYPTSSAGKVHIGDVPWNVITATEGYKSIPEYGDAAIYIIKRTGGEGYDLPATSGASAQYGNENYNVISTNDGTYGDYLQLSETEKSVLRGLKSLKDSGKVKKVILILNMASTIQLDCLDDPAFGIDSCVWTGSVGEVGTVAVAKLLTGEYNFSGHASTTLWKDNLKNPVNNNFMDQNYFFTYDNYEQFGFINPALNNQFQSTFTTYTVYQEGMYLGYKYTETRYEDYVSGTGNAGNYIYSDVVSYPFGYGLSYTDFDFSNLSVEKEGKEYKVSVDVKNTGNVAGKTAVQIYAAKPYGEYAKANNIQVPSVELVGFEKSPELKPGETKTVTAIVNEKFLTSYDTEGAGTYITMDGTYYLIAAEDAHEAVNSLLAAKGMTPANTNGRMDAEGHKELTGELKYSFDDKTFSVSSKTGNPITNAFSFADINTYEGRGDNHVDYYSRDNWEGTVKLPERAADGTLIKHNAVLTLTQKMADDMRNQMDASVVIEKGGEYPAYGEFNGYTLLDFADVSYDNVLWEKLLDQLTWDETVDLLSNGRHKTQAIASVTKPGTGDENGPNGFSQTYAHKNLAGSAYSGPTNPLADRIGGFDAEGNYIADPDIEEKYTTTGFSSNGVLAATFNREIAEKVGRQIGEEGLWGGQSGLLGIGLNIIRTPYAGRTAEYVSEDANLSGLISAPEIAAIESKGVHCFIKHCALNECETARHGVCTWVTEQALRENYLRAFEIGFQDGGAFNVMTSFNRMGVEAVANSITFTQRFLRNECGLPGIVETDCAGDMTDGAHGEAYVSRICNVYTGASDLNEYNYAADAPDYTGSEFTFADFAPVSEGGSGEYGNLGQSMREAAKRILYSTLHSNAMNGMTSDTRVVRITPSWQKLMIAADIVFGVCLASSVLWLAMSLLLDKKRRNL